VAKSGGCFGRVLFAGAVWLSLGGAVLAHGYKQNGIELVHPWIMETETADVGGSVFMKIVNGTAEPDRLVAVRSPLAETADLEASSNAAVAFVVPAHGELILTKSGPHIALGGLKKPLHAYGTLPLHLVFERAGEMRIEVMVEEAQ
jgi:copper(I)-binding protein